MESDSGKKKKLEAKDENEISGKTAKQPLAASREDYYDFKHRILRWEKDNYTRIAVVQTPNGWYKMFDHSAIIYCCHIAPALGVRAALANDSDFEHPTDSPVYVFKDLEKMETRLKKAKIYRSTPLGMAVVFELGYRIDAGDLVAMQKEKEVLRERANKIILPNAVFPALKNELEILTARVYETVRKMNETARFAIGNNMLAVCIRLSEDFIEAANGHIDMDKYLKTAVREVRRIGDKLLIMSALRLLEDDKIFRMVTQVNKVQKKLAGALEHRAKEK